MQFAIILLTVASLAAVAACSLIDARRTGEQAVAGFHAKLGVGDFEQIYAETTADFRARTTLTRLVDELTRVRTRLGELRSTTEMEFNVTGGSSGERVALKYHSQFVSGEADEYFVWTVTRGAARLDSYQADSPLLR